ncbi:hypothetical protein COCNU_03G005870 [Cocos nucifera]|uniref:Uncharacterized protein n=1 Tax=Cocos nucifera TaxID=13894 RepID=A0A8K0MYE3_COCNU|nr:hypothetical protein COCNU_03G005870 [Cocos nucifera]
MMTSMTAVSNRRRGNGDDGKMPTIVGRNYCGRSEGKVDVGDDVRRRRRLGGREVRQQFVVEMAMPDGRRDRRRRGLGRFVTRKKIERVWWRVEAASAVSGGVGVDGDRREIRGGSSSAQAIPRESIWNLDFKVSSWMMKFTKRMKGGDIVKEPSAEFSKARTTIGKTDGALE